MVWKTHLFEGRKWHALAYQCPCSLESERLVKKFFLVIGIFLLLLNFWLLCLCRIGVVTAGNLILVGILVLIVALVAFVVAIVAILVRVAAIIATDGGTVRRNF